MKFAHNMGRKREKEWLKVGRGEIERERERLRDTARY
jgi:hypothetical protein